MHQGLLCTCSQKQNFSWIRQKQRISPLTPIVKIAHFGNVMSIDLTLLNERFLQWGSMGIFYDFCRIQLKFCSWLYKKRWHTSWEFQFEKTSNKKNIAQKPLTNLLKWTVDLYGECFLLLLMSCLFQHCNLEAGSYTKDLSAINRDLSSIFILDNSPVAYRAYPGKKAYIASIVGDYFSIICRAWKKLQQVTHRYSEF